MMNRRCQQQIALRLQPILSADAALQASFSVKMQMPLFVDKMNGALSMLMFLVGKNKHFSICSCPFSNMSNAGKN